MVCKKCGTCLDEGENTCIHCGYSLKKDNSLDDSSNNHHKGRNVIRVVTLVLIFVICCCLILIIFNQNNADISNDVEENNEYAWSGVYAIDDIMLYIYQYDLDKMYFNYNDKENNFLIFSNVEENVAKVPEDVFLLTLNGNGINYKDDKIKKNVDLIKIRDYSLNDFYKDYYGDNKYLNTKFNGEFVNENVVIKMFQMDEKIVNVSLNGKIDNGYFNYNYYFEILNNELVFEIEDISKINIIVDNNEIIVKTSVANIDDKLNAVEGKYKRIKNYSMKDVVSTFFPH